MGFKYNTYLNGNRIYGCRGCHTHLAISEDILAKGKTGEAYLFNNVGRQEQRSMLTGIYDVQDVLCRSCAHILGWTYVKSYSHEENYKEGKFVLEVAALNVVQ